MNFENLYSRRCSRLDNTTQGNPDRPKGSGLILMRLMKDETA